MQVDPDGQSREFLGGFVEQAVRGNALDTYLRMRPSEIVHVNALGEEDSSLDFADLQPAQNIERIYRLQNGDVLIHTIGDADPDFNLISRWNPQQGIVWSSAVDGPVTQNIIDVRQDSIIYGMTDVRGGDQAVFLRRLRTDG